MAPRLHESEPPITERLRAVRRALPLLQRLAERQSIFDVYAGHLLIAFFLIGTTSRSSAIRRQALRIGSERARHWVGRWQRTRRRLNADTVVDELGASYAAAEMGIEQPHIRRELAAVIARYSPRELLYFDPRFEGPPADVPDDCDEGHLNEPGRRRCFRCRKYLQPRSKYDIWYYALTNAYFCERYGIPLQARFIDVLGQLPQFRPYPSPGALHYRDCVYAITHVVYTLSDYGRARLSPRALPAELRFLQTSMHWALEQREPDTVAEIVDSLAACGVRDDDPRLIRGRRFLLQTQHADGGWGDDDDDYGRFHTIWAAIDGLRDYRWRPARLSRTLRRALRGPLRERQPNHG